MVKRRKSIGNEKEVKIIQENCVISRTEGNDGDVKRARIIAAGDEAGESQPPESERSVERAERAVVGEPAIIPGEDGVDSAPSRPQPIHQIATRSVTGRLKGRCKRNASPPLSPIPTKKPVPVIEQELKAASNTPEPKTRRHWELWSTTDKDMFFKGLNEFGKDFDAIQNLITQNNNKKKADVEVTGIKSKDQIRHFYYRTWHKISKHLDFDNEDDVSKQALELYGLINYGELRKRIGSKLDEKSGQKLKELIHKGSTTVKVKGANRRLKTPVCKVLKKLNHIDINKDELPEKVTVELVPSCSKGWSYVQSLAQNPRLRMRIATATRISSLIGFLNKKWKPERLRMKESLGEIEIPTSDLKLSPPKETKLQPIIPKPTTANIRSDLTYEAYKENMKNLALAGLSGTNQSPQNKKGPKSGLSKNQNDDHSKVKSTKDLKTAESEDGSKSNGIHLSASGSALVNLGSGAMGPPDCATDNAIMGTDAFLRIANASAKQQSPCKEISADKLNSLDDPKVEPENSVEPPEIQEDEKVKTLGSGLTSKEGDGFTVGDVYCMVGMPRKFMLRYEWVERVKAPTILELNENISNVLRRLVHLAKLEFAEFNKKSKPAILQEASSPPKNCTCGFIKTSTPPPKGSKNSPAGGRNKRPSTPKNSRRAQAEAKTPGTPKSTRTTISTEPSSPVPIAIKPEAVKPTVPPAVSSPIAVLPCGSGDAVFRVPTAIPPKSVTTTVRQVSPNTLADQHLLQQIRFHKQPDLFMAPNRQKPMRRNIRKPLVVQRTLLPKAQVPSRQIMTLTVLPNDQQGMGTGSFMPVVSNPALAGVMGQPIPPPRSLSTAGSVTPSIITMAPTSLSKVRRIIPSPVAVTNLPESNLVEKPPAPISDILKQAAAQANIITTQAQGQVPFSVELLAAKTTFTSTITTSQPVISTTVSTMSQAITGMDAFLSDVTTPGEGSTRQETPVTESSATGLSGRSPPPNISALLDISLPAPPDISDSTDRLLDMAICSSKTSFSGILESTTVSKGSSKNGSPPASPARFRTINSQLSAELQWLNGEDFNLSNFLNDSPLKNKGSSSSLFQSSTSENSGNNVPPPAFLLNESSRDSVLGKLDVESALQCMMNENSLDYVAKFADLAAQVAATADEGSSVKPEKQY